jgi:hypothetical protein
MNPDMLARLREIMRGAKSTVRPREGVTSVTELRQNSAELRQLRELRLHGENGSSASANATDRLPPNDDEAEIEERAGLASDRIPAVYLDAWALLNCQKPANVSETEWRRALDDGGRFLDQFGKKAAAIGWTPGELFDIGAGVVWRLAGELVVGIGTYRVLLQGGRGLDRRR